MSCKEAIRLVCEYLEGRLSTPVTTDVRRHFAECEHCSLVMEAAQHTLEVDFDRVPAGSVSKVA